MGVAIGCSGGDKASSSTVNPAVGGAGMTAAPGGGGGTPATGGAGTGVAGATLAGAGRGGAGGDSGGRSSVMTSGAGGSGAGGGSGSAGMGSAGMTIDMAGRAAGGATAAGSGAAGASAAMPKKFVGNITTSNAVRDGFVMYWDQITPENEGKWGSVQPSQGSFNWAALDKIYAYAQSNDLIFKQHTFVWGSQQPSWVNASNAEASVKAWMKAFCERYPNTKLIDVVNEPPPHTTPAYIEGMGGAGTSGYDWIVNAFKWARAACPNAILILNDYNIIEYGNDNTHIIDIATKIKAAGAPVDAIGAQAHDAFKVSTATAKGFIDKIASSTGLPVYITEYDIAVADDNQQKMIMQDQITMFWNDDNVKGITLWGYIVGATWKMNTGLQQPDGKMRPAMTWLMEFLGH